MRILFNATAALHGTSGFVHTTCLLGEISRLSSAHQFVVLSSPAQDALRDALPDFAHHVLPSLSGSGLSRTVRLQLALPRLARDLGADLVYHKGNFYAFRAGPQVCFIENSNPFSVLDLGESVWYRTRNGLLRIISNEAVRRAAALIFPSQTARDIIMRRAPVRAPSFVVPYGADLARPADPRSPVNGPFVLCVAAVFPYKNLVLAVEALDILRQRGAFDGSLVIVGVSHISGASYYHRLLTRRIADLHLEGHVHLLRPMDRERLAELYATAECLLMPSIEETFGIPVIEAMSVGTPVVASRVTGARAGRYFIPFEEICGQAAEYFDPFDVSSCAAAIERAIEPDHRSELVDAGHRRAHAYSWRAAAEKTLAVFDTLG